MPYYVLQKLYYCLVYPYLTYGIELFGGVSQYSIDKLIKTSEKKKKKKKKKLIVAQKRAVRAINYNDHTSRYFAKSEILKFEDL